MPILADESPISGEILTLVGLVCAGLVAARFMYRLYQFLLHLGWQLLPQQRHRAAPWTGFEIGLAVFAYFAVILLVHDGLTQIGFFTRLYGADFDEALAAAKDDPRHDIAAARRSMWSASIAFPLQAILIPYAFRRLSETEPYQLGLTLHRVGPNVSVGVMGWLIVSPLLYALNVLVMLCLLRLPGLEPERHPLEQMLRDHPLFADWFVVFFSAVLGAPILEELVFRGVLQAWLIQRRWGSDAAMAAALAFALLARSEKLQTAWFKVQLDRDWVSTGGLLYELGPAFFVALMVPGYLWVEWAAWRWLPWPNAARTIYATALLFGAVHSFAWPTPIPLFVLGLVLGWLAYRTQSLVPSITLHALFNLVACTTLLVSQGAPKAGPEKGKEETTAARRAAAVSTSTAIPASWPRRI